MQSGCSLLLRLAGHGPPVKRRTTWSKLGELQAKKEAYQSTPLRVIVAQRQATPHTEGQMPTSDPGEVIAHLRRTEYESALTDRQLLEGYLSRRDELAVAALVHRHGAMVWGVCRRLLGNHHDAEDAFQATFLVLVRRAESIVPREMVANWLHGVARQTALKARATAAKRAGRERQVTEMPEPTVARQDLWHDLQPIVDEELSRLPRKYRAVIVLCDLEAMTREEAARQLGVPAGTVAGRLARARAMLGRRLARHGLATAGGIFAVGLVQNAAAAAAPSSVVANTIRAAAGGAISTPVAALTQGVLRTMLLNKLTVTTVVVLIALAIVGGGSLALLPMAAGQKAADSKAPADDKKTDKDRLQGTWIAVSAERNGVKIEAGDDVRIRSMTMTFDGDKVTISPLAGNDPRPYALDPDKSPREMDIGDEEKPTVRIATIYAFDGDKLKWHYVRDGARPSDFDTSKSNGIVIVFEKKK